MNHIIFGTHAVFEALSVRPQDVYQVVVMEDRQSKKLKNVIEIAKQKRCPIEIKNRRSFEKWISQRTKGDVGNLTHQGVAIETRSKNYISLSELETLIQTKNKIFILVLDHLADPHNVGALLRSAACCGVDVVCFPKQGAAQLSPTVYKVAAGGIEHLALCRVANIRYLLSLLNKWQVKCFGLDMKGDRSIYEVSVPAKVAMVIGSEEEGFNQNVAQSCDEIVRIPMSSALESLNASVAGSIGLFEFAHRQETS